MILLIYNDMGNHTINIPEDFTRFPGGRCADGNNNSGEELRDRLLWPELQKVIANGEKLQIILDGGAGYGSSFLDEAFGGLVRKYHVGFDTLKDKLVFVSEEDPYCEEEIWEYIENAASGK